MLLSVGSDSYTGDGSARRTDQQVSRAYASRAYASRCPRVSLSLPAAIRVSSMFMSVRSSLELCRVHKPSSPFFVMHCTETPPPLMLVHVAKLGIPLQALRRSLGSKPRRTNVCDRSAVNVQIRPNVGATIRKLVSVGKFPSEPAKCLRCCCKRWCGLRVCDVIDRDCGR